MTILALRILKLDLTEILQQSRWDLLNFGPSVEIDYVEGSIFEDIALVDAAFKVFISDESTEAPKRNELVILDFNFTNQQVIHSIFRAILEVFDKVRQPQKLFQKISVHCHKNNIKQLENQVKQDNILKMVRQVSHQKEKSSSRVFSMNHKQLKLALEVEFEMNTDRSLAIGHVHFNLIHL